MFSEKHFQLEQFVVSHRIPRHIVIQDHKDLMGGIILEAIAHFTMGSQVRVTTRNETRVVAYVPATGWDYFKDIITGWTPSLRWGWLAPRFKPVTAVVEVEEKWINVIPTEMEGNRRQVRMGRVSDAVRMNGPLPTIKPLSSLDWLEGEPATKEDVARAIAAHQLHQLRLGDHIEW